MKKIGVTGAAGFVGSHLCERLLAEDYEVVGVDDLSYGSMANIGAVPATTAASRSRCSTARSARPLRAAFDGCDAIMHLAAKKIPRYGGTLATLEVNVDRRQRGLRGRARARRRPDRHVHLRRLRRRHAALRARTASS